jgi:hypothetical protein
MNITEDTANAAYAVLTQHLKIARSKPAERYFRETVVRKKKCNLAEISGEGITWWNLGHSNIPELDYRGTDPVVAASVANANQALKDLFSTLP